MNRKLSVFTIAMILAVAVFATTQLNSTAEAMKSQGTSIPKYGIATKSKVCGDRLCSEPSAEQKMAQMTQAEPKQTQSQTMTQQQLQMPKISESMSRSEIMDSMMLMMDQHRNMMIQNMAQMTKQELYDHSKMMIEHMSQMGSDHSGMSGMQMGMDKEMGMDHSQMDKSEKQMDMEMKWQKAPLYNEMLNPSQIEYPNIVGFNDLHIEAIRHLDPNGDDSKLAVIVHHHCKVYDDMTAACFLFPTGMTDQDKPYGMEYIITAEQFKELPDAEKPYWHYHLTELPKAKASFPDLTTEQLASLKPVLNETYGKVFYFWNTDDKYPMGEPSVLVIQNLPE